MFFRDRADAGAQLARRLDQVRAAGPVVLGLPRGGVPVAAPVAAALAAPLDVLVVRKLGVPGRPELAMGAVGEGGVVVLEERALAAATDELVVLSSPPGFRSVGQAYADFHATEDDEVLALLRGR